jgi:hypothetical protein
MNIQDLKRLGPKSPIRIKLTDEQWNEVWKKFATAEKERKENNEHRRLR